MKVKSTLEHHWFCPYCERSCLSRVHKIYKEKFELVIRCPDCNKTYTIIHNSEKPEIEK